MIVLLTIAECLILKKKLCHSLNQSDWKLKTPEPVVTCLFTVLVQQIILNCNALPSLLLNLNERDKSENSQLPTNLFSSWWYIFLLFGFRAHALKTIARTTPLVKAVLPKRDFAVCVLLDSKVKTATKVNPNIIGWSKLTERSRVV